MSCSGGRAGSWITSAYIGSTGSKGCKSECGFGGVSASARNASRVPRPVAANQHWRMDFVHNPLSDGQPLRILTVIDQWSRESLSLEAAFSLTCQDVADALERPS